MVQSLGSWLQRRNSKQRGLVEESCLWRGRQEAQKQGRGITALALSQLLASWESLTTLPLLDAGCPGIAILSEAQCPLELLSHFLITEVQFPTPTFERGRGLFWPTVGKGFTSQSGIPKVEGPVSEKLLTAERPEAERRQGLRREINASRLRVGDLLPAASTS